ncbi:U3 small nucleolar RNA-associated protein 15 homolog [Anabrus simplex]|uniref:U3 small nucleolar RNA-associated protein 15 homolog n=1 Tax=Anabrus simplex TaxID=316456 RepID=UPI0034DDA385
MMASFKKTNAKIFAKPGPKTTPDTVYWKKLGVPVLVKEFGPIDYIDFSPVQPHYFALTCSVRVQIYNPITKLVFKTLSRFRETAYGATFRSDGRLLCAGGEENHVKLFDVKSKSLLRVFKGHTGAVHRCYFTADKTHIASFSDDKSVAFWDIPSEKQVSSFSEHQDYIRAGAVSPVSPDIFLSGGYDNIVRMYDTRTNVSVFHVDHGAPVESLLFLPTGGIFMSAGGTEVRVWDAFSGGRLLAKLSQHHKTITCLHLASDNKRLLSGSLDHHVKIYDIATYQVVHTLDYPNAILSLGVSPGDETVVVGMVDGVASISRREEEERITKQERKRISFRYAPDNFRPASADIVVPELVLDRISKHDECLRKFQYSKALDCVLIPFVVNKNPMVTVAVYQELLRRKGLQTALAGREGKALLVVLRFLIKYIGDYRFTRVLLDVTNILLDIYDDASSLSLEAKKLFVVLAERVKAEEKLTVDLTALQGELQLLLSGASVAETKKISAVEEKPILPSRTAQSYTVR